MRLLQRGRQASGASCIWSWLLGSCHRRSRGIGLGRSERPERRCTGSDRGAVAVAIASRNDVADVLRCAPAPMIAAMRPLVPGLPADRDVARDVRAVLPELVLARAGRMRVLPHAVEEGVRAVLDQRL